MPNDMAVPRLCARAKRPRRDRTPAAGRFQPGERHPCADRPSQVAIVRGLSCFWWRATRWRSAPPEPRGLRPPCADTDADGGRIRKPGRYHGGFGPCSDPRHGLVARTVRRDRIAGRRRFDRQTAVQDQDPRAGGPARPRRWRRSGRRCPDTLVAGRSASTPSAGSAGRSHRIPAIGRSGSTEDEPEPPRSGRRTARTSARGPHRVTGHVGGRARHGSCAEGRL